MKKYKSLKRIKLTALLSVETIKKICEAGLTDAKRVGREWFVNEAELAARLNGPEVTSFINSLHKFDRLKTVLAVLVLLIISTALLNQFIADLSSRPLPAFNTVRSPNPSLLAQINLGLNQVDFKELTAQLDLSENWRFLKDRIMTNWLYFLGLKQTETMTAGALVNDPQLQLLIRELVAQELQNKLNELLGEAATPPRQVAIQDPRALNLRERIAQYFSDRVTVNVNPLTGSAVITPIFQGGTGAPLPFDLGSFTER